MDYQQLVEKAKQLIAQITNWAFATPEHLAITAFVSFVITGAILILLVRRHSRKATRRLERERHAQEFQKLKDDLPKFGRRLARRIIEARKLSDNNPVIEVIIAAAAKAFENAVVASGNPSVDPDFGLTSLFRAKELGTMAVALAEEMKTAPRDDEPE